MIGKDDKRGTWFVQIKIKDPVTGKTAWKKKRGFATKREAKLFEAKMMEDKNLPTHKATFREVSEQYFISKECSPDTIQKHRSRYSKLPFPTITTCRSKRLPAPCWKNGETE